MLKKIARLGFIIAELRVALSVGNFYKASHICGGVAVRSITLFS
jgi:hypothetical protein